MFRRKIKQSIIHIVIIGVDCNNVVKIGNTCVILCIPKNMYYIIITFVLRRYLISYSLSAHIAI